MSLPMVFLEVCFVILWKLISWTMSSMVVYLESFLCFVFCFVFVTARMSFTFIMWCLQQSANKCTDPDALDDSTSPKHEEEDEP